MIPSSTTVVDSLSFTDTRASKNYKMHRDTLRVKGYVDELVAMEQVIYKILNTERYRYEIYSWNYGVELESLLGQHITYVLPEIERRITEALTQDDRINRVDTFEFDITKKKIVVVSFWVRTVFGNLQLEQEVSY